MAIRVVKVTNTRTHKPNGTKAKRIVRRKAKRKVQTL